MPDLPRGTVTFLFTDIEDSTRLWEEHPDAMRAALAHHDQLVRSYIEDRNGLVVKDRGEGDSIFAVFGRASDAVAAACALQEVLATESWPTPEPLLMRIALHTGEAELREADYYGPVVNRCARLRSRAQGGQILLSLATEQLVRDWLPEGIHLEDLGEHLLKGMRRPERIFRLATPHTVQKKSSPYRGLAAFREEDTSFFFGRDEVTRRLVEAVRQKPFVAVIGPSGNGKSSVVFAGLLPALRRDGGCRVIAFRPGDKPFEAVAAALLPVLESELSEVDRLLEVQKLAAAMREGTVSLRETLERCQVQDAHGGLLLLVADQFEELYTLCPTAEEQRRFLLELLLATEARDVDTSRALVCLVITLRADFLGHALAHRPLADALQDAATMLGPMNRAELRQAIERPAQQLGNDLEEGLAERLLDAVSDSPGSLPLLEFVLAQLWLRREGRRLTHAAYETTGGVDKALAGYAEEFYGRTGAEERQRVERVFLQLVRPGVGTEDTRRRATRAEIGEENWGVVRQLADARLVVTGRNEATGDVTAEVVHEALIREWDRLRDWIERERRFRTWQEWLRGVMAPWQANPRQRGILLQEGPLQEAIEWLRDHRADLSAAEQVYIKASRRAQTRQILIHALEIAVLVLILPFLPWLGFLIPGVGNLPVGDLTTAPPWVLWSVAVLACLLVVVAIWIRIGIRRPKHGWRGRGDSGVVATNGRRRRAPF